jgi:hypothetical protein
VVSRHDYNRPRQSREEGARAANCRWRALSPCCREFTENFIEFRASRRLEAAKKSFINDLQINSLRTGNFLLPNRELNQAFREFSGRIRESDLWLTFCPVPGARRPAALLGPWGFTRQPRSPKRLGHRPGQYIFEYYRGSQKQTSSAANRNPPKPYMRRVPWNGSPSRRTRAEPPSAPLAARAQQNSS